MQETGALNWYGHRRFVKRSILNDPKNAFVKNDTVIIRYQVEMVISSGGALPEQLCTKADRIRVFRRSLRLKWRSMYLQF